MPLTTTEIAPDRLLRLQEVLAIVGVSRSTLYDMIGRGQFPKGVRVARRCVRWHESDVLEWVATRRSADRSNWT